jgi:hypothetical protein
MALNLNPSPLIMKKFNSEMALKWMVFLPLILPVCIAVGMLEGAADAAANE